MKTRLVASVLLPALLLSFSTALAVEVQPIQPTQPKQIRISDAASVLLKLSRGDVNEQVIIAYIENAKRNFDLSADEIVYLKQQGVTDRIVTAALSHHAKIPQMVVTVPQVRQQETQAPVVVQPQPTIVVAPPQTAYVQTSPAPVYVYSSPSYRYYDPFPYSYSYYPYRHNHYGYRYPSYRYSSPRFSVNFGFGHGYGGHGNFGYHHAGFSGGFGSHHHR